MSKVDLEEQVSLISDEFNFFKTLYDKELHELQESLKETFVVVQMDNSRGLNMDQVVSEVKAQYEDIAARSREEAESWHKSKFDQMSAEADQYGDEMRSTKGQISEFNWMLARLQNEIQAVNAQCTNLEGQIADTEQRGRGRAGRQGSHQGPGAGSAEGQAEHGSAAQRVPGAHESQAGPGHRDLHLQETAGGRGGKSWTALYCQHPNS